jgi:hypothetical protein
MIRGCILLALGVLLAAPAAEDRPARKSGSRQPAQVSRCTEVPARPFDIILGRPTSNSVAVTVLCFERAEGFIACGTATGNLAVRTPSRSFMPGEPAGVLLSGLQPDTRYYYRLCLAHTNSAEYSFHTARAAGHSFTFTVTADSHLDENTDPQVYLRTLANVLADGPDFHLDLGDTFMTEKHPDREEAAKQYLAQRYYLGQLCHSAPLFLVLGNHDGENPRGRLDDNESLATWSNTMRKRYFPNPIPGGFYTGNASQHPEAGQLENYYAWEWGDALFLVLDPYWSTPRRRGGNDLWNPTLGSEQYRWLQRTLEGSRARFKFVFIHQLVGGADIQNRGGAEAAPFYEWGGKNADGTDGFAQRRAGWPASIHQLLVQSCVSIVFHGHDHFYAHQELDGIVYQLVPQPGYPRDNRAPRSAAEYGYVGGKILGSPGHLRVTVSPDRTTADYVASNRSVAYSYSIQAGNKP